MRTLILLLLLALPAYAEEPTPTPEPSPTATVAPVACRDGRHPTDPALPCTVVVDPVMQLNTRVTALEQTMQRVVNTIQSMLAPQPTPTAGKKPAR